jgi:phage baseplate assembly protein W
MTEEYFPLPIPFESLLDGRDFPKVDLKLSVRQRMHLLLVTFFGESRYDEEFGSSIWEHDFENISNVTAWKDNVSKALYDALINHEKRIHKIKVKVEIMPEEISDIRFQHAKQIRKKLEVTIDATLVKTNEYLPFTEQIYISPISLD